MNFELCKIEKVALGGMKLVEKNGRRYLVAHTVTDEWFVTDEDCTHETGPLSEGELNNYEITCPVHGAVFDCRTGEAMGLPATEPLKIYKVKIKDNRVTIDI